MGLLYHNYSRLEQTHKDNVSVQLEQIFTGQMPTDSIKVQNRTIYRQSNVTKQYLLLPHEYNSLKLIACRSKTSIIKAAKHKQIINRNIIHTTDDTCLL